MPIALLVNIATYTIIARTAEDCAREHVAQGWQSSGHAYDLGSFTGDLEALWDALGREPTRDERLTLEAEIRNHLTRAARQ